VSLSAGSRLGPYEIVAPLGAGGMGEVYRAKDPRLGREVAVKVLPASFSTDPDRLRRFEQEARAAGLLNHPNITAVYDIGSHDGAPYVVTELLEGETLRSRIAAGALSTRKALDYAIQIARGLAAAHEKGIVHRDLKPENLFVTKDGRVKILDFGLAKLTQSEEGVDLTELPTATRGTEPGVVMGTLGYMSPEQLRGKAIDHRSDIFAFGVILWEMLSGRRAFQAETAADTMMAILTKDPPELSTANPDVSPGLDRIVRHCLEKNVDERFHSASDLAFDLEALSGISTPKAAVVVPAAAARRPAPRILPAATAVIVAALIGFLSYRAGKAAGHGPPPSFHQLTFQRGELGGAFFAPDGHTIVYSAAWEGKPREVFVHRLESPESRPFGSEGDVLAMSRTSELAVCLNRRPYIPFVGIGRLARIPLAGGAPREILDDVQWADWSPDGRELAIVRDVGAHNRLEFPIGKVLYETNGWISHPRVSPDGRQVAFIDHPVLRDDGGSIAIVDREGKKTTLTSVYSTAQGLTWTPDGREVWFTAAEEGYNRAIHAVSPSGKDRLVNRVAGVSTIKDISQNGQVLMTQDITRMGMPVGAAGERGERELSWLDWSVATDLSPDGKMVLFFEGGEAGGSGYFPYLRKTDGSPAVRLGEGNAQALSPDGRWALCIVHPATEAFLVAFPTGVGETRSFPKDGVRPLVADWLPDGKHVLITATEPNRGTRLYLRDLQGGKARPLSPEGYRHFERAVSLDGRVAAVRGPDRRLYLYPLEGGEPTALNGLTADDVPVRFDRDGRWLYVYRQGSIPLQVDRYEISSGRRERWKEVAPADTAGLSAINRFVTTPDGQAYAYSYIRNLSYLQLADGLK
jgi:hypothetical protein